MANGLYGKIPLWTLLMDSRALLMEWRTKLLDSVDIFGRYV
jgi:hypothetical protein